MTCIFPLSATILRVEGGIKKMETTGLISAIDDETARLSKVRELLAGRENGAAAPPRKERRHLSPEARKRIADAQRRRWAAQKKAAK